jgi:6-phosphogluconolactonase
VSQFTIGSNGALAPMAVPSIAAPSARSVVIDPAGRNAYVANYAGNEILHFTIASDGALAPSGTTAAAATGPWILAMDPLGRYVYASTGASVSQYTIAGDSGLLPMTPPKVVATDTVYVAVDAAGNAYVADRPGKVLQYHVGASGALAPMSPASVSGGVNPYAIAFEPSARFVYVSDFGASGTVWWYAKGAGGVLSQLGSVFTGGSTPTSIAIARAR